MPGMPSYALSTGYRAWREKLVDGMEKWVRAQDGAKIEGGAKVSDEKMESRFILERDALVRGIMGVGVRERAIEMLGLLHEYVYSNPSRSKSIRLSMDFVKAKY